MPTRRRGQGVIRVLATLVVLAALAGGGAWAYWRYAKPVVLVTDVVEGPVRAAFYATGALEPDREFPIKSNVDGIVTEVLVDKGACVYKGQKLATVSADDLQLRFKQTEADLSLKKRLADEAASPVLQEFADRLKAAKEQLDIAERELERVKTARAKGGATQADLDHSEDRKQVLWTLYRALQTQRDTRRAELDRDVKVAQAALDIAQWNLEQQTLKSPIDGRVLDRPVSPGTRVRANDHVLRLADVTPHNLVMRAKVDEEDKIHVKEGQVVQVSLYSYGRDSDRRPFVGAVKQIYPQADEQRRFEVDVAIPDSDNSFAPGMTGELAFLLESRDKCIVVPPQAVQENSVWVVHEGKVHKAHVKVGLRNEYRTEILTGVKPGEQVVVSPAATLQSKQEVRTRYLDPDTAAGLGKPKPTDGSFKGGGI